MFGILIASGSSPWARGTHHFRMECILIYRFIPVGTGNTLQVNYLTIVSAVHPRGHGEHFLFDILVKLA